MKNTIIQISLFLGFILGVNAQEKLDEIIPVRGICLSIPDNDNVDRFVKFINEELVPKKVNTMVLMIHYNYEYKSHPELVSDNAISKKDLKTIVKACKDGGIRLIPQVNLLGHQSWHGKVYTLLTEYPQFNETPKVVMPADGEYEWPNPDGLYCLSYCPLHPDVHAIVFDLVDEIMEVCEADAFHAGMDEVFYLGHDQCPRCRGRDKAELFAGEITKIRNHLAKSGKELWIWGDRLIDGKTTGIGVWSGSMNNTHRSIDMIPKDVVINDWHYRRANPTAALFALKGFKVITCPWGVADVAKTQLHQMVNFRKHATDETKENYAGMMQTIWSGTTSFMDGYYGITDPESRRGNQVKCFNTLFEEINKLDD
ncbi:family 20 glycosylhydrolase [Bacteroidota bacterium]